jgi:hypothetical protein
MKRSTFLKSFIAGIGAFLTGNLNAELPKSAASAIPWFEANRWPSGDGSMLADIIWNNPLLPNAKRCFLSECYCDRLRDLWLSTPFVSTWDYPAACEKDKYPYIERLDCIGNHGTVWSKVLWSDLQPGDFWRHVPPENWPEYKGTIWQIVEAPHNGKVKMRVIIPPSYT